MLLERHLKPYWRSTGIDASLVSYHVILRQFQDTDKDHRSAVAAPSVGYGVAKRPGAAHTGKPTLTRVQRLIRIDFANTNSTQKYSSMVPTQVASYPMRIRWHIIIERIGSMLVVDIILPYMVETWQQICFRMVTDRE